MNTTIIGQGYNLSEDTSVGKELIELFESGIYDAFTCLVAFASYGGISALSPYVLKAKERGMRLKIILGIDQKGTSKEALEEVLSWGVESKIYHTDAATIFHPKVYLFENRDIFTLIVGSSNLTTRGLVQNVECSLLIKDTRDGNSVHGAFYDYWKDLLDGTENNLYPLTEDLINNLYTDNIISAEEVRAIRYDDGTDKGNNLENRKTVFKKTPIQKLPNGFKPKRLAKVIKVRQSQDPKTKECNTIREEKTLPIGEDILVAEIGGGPRWKQVNFPVTIFQNFFGAERGNNKYTIKLQNIAKDGTLGDMETRQAVTVASNNFRFEIHCAETSMQYPGNTSRPIGLFVKLNSSTFMYQVLMPTDEPYSRIKDFLYREAIAGRKGELKRCVVHIEAIHALYPSLII